MRRRPLHAMTLLLLAAGMATPGVAHAVEDFGVRVGGYGFRTVSTASLSWSDRRMDGLGLFFSQSVGGWLFAEAGVDFYQATTDSVAAGAPDRLSTQASAAVGVRPLPWFFLSPYLQAGVGGELTRVAVSGGPEETWLLPFAFLGVGSDLRLGDHLSVGANVRAHVVSRPNDTRTRAGQAQVFARYSI